MTLIICTKCRCGIVLGADRKLVGPGTAFSYECKIIRLPSPPLSFFAPTGITGLADTFIELYESRITTDRPTNIREARFIAEDVMRMLADRYKESLPPWLREIEGILVGVGEEPQAYRMIGGAPAEKLKRVPIIIGAGVDYARSFIPMLSSDIEPEEAAESIAWIISYVSQFCDPVGFEPERGPDLIALLTCEEGRATVKSLNREKAAKIGLEARMKGERLKEILLPHIVEKGDLMEPPSDFFT